MSNDKNETWISVLGLLLVLSGVCVVTYGIYLFSDTLAYVFVGLFCWTWGRNCIKGDKG